jgi:hypothetical protein
MTDPHPNATKLAARFDDALGWAVELHRNQRRKGSNTPYTGHLLGVCSIVLEDGGDEEEAMIFLHVAAIESLALLPPAQTQPSFPSLRGESERKGISLSFRTTRTPGVYLSPISSTTLAPSFPTMRRLGTSYGSASTLDETSSSGTTGRSPRNSAGCDLAGSPRSSTDS